MASELKLSEMGEKQLKEVVSDFVKDLKREYEIQSADKLQVLVTLNKKDKKVKALVEMRLTKIQVATRIYEL